MANLKNTLSNMTVVETIILIKEKKISPVEVVKSFLDEIDSKNPEINAFCTVVHDEALREAKRYEEEIIKNGDVGPLYGLPVAIKDLTLTKGIRTTFGSKVFENFIPDRDSIVVERIKKAGGIILGKTNTPEFGHKGTTDNMIFGATKNPHDPGLTTGGSSGGSAAAVAGGMIPFAEGSDGGGSIRIPASLCGVFGLKPTYGRIPNDTDEKNLFATQNPFIHHGPISKTVEDGALLFEIMKGPHPVDPFSLPFISENILAEIDA